MNISIKNLIWQNGPFWPKIAHAHNSGSAGTIFLKILHNEGG